MKRIMLTSTGFDNPNLQRLFITHIYKPIDKVKALFIPTAAIDQESIDILPACRKDLTDAGVLNKNIVTYDLDKKMSVKELNEYDVLYMCGGDDIYLMNRIILIDMRDNLIRSVNNGLFYIGVSAGSTICCTGVIENGLDFIPNYLEPHSTRNITPDGPLPPKNKRINLSDNQAVWITDTETIILS